MPVSSFSTVASDNGNRLPSGTAIENMSPSQINDGIRALMQCVREWYNEGEWIEYGSGNGVVTYTRTGDNSLSIPANVVTQFHANRRVKILDGSGNTLYGRVTASTFSSPNTNLTLEFDGGATLGSGSPVSVKFGIVSSQNTSMPSAMPVASIVSYAGATAPQGFLICDGSLVSKTTYGDLFGVIGTTYGTGNATQFVLPDLRGKFSLGKSSSFNLGTSGGAFAQIPTGTISSSFTGNSLTPSGSVSVSGTVANHTLTESQLPSHRHEVGNILDEGTGTGGNRSFGTTYGRGSTRTGVNVRFANAQTSLNYSALTSFTGGGSAHSHGFSGSGSFSGNAVTPSGSVASSFSGASVDITNPYLSLNYIIKF
tara:strand:+ start:4662 stop:5768 length:1107 start_codon:yes stop_codon:yes gene_type:complete